MTRGPGLGGRQIGGSSRYGSGPWRQIRYRSVDRRRGSSSCPSCRPGLPDAGLPSSVGIVEWRPNDAFKACVEGTYTRSDTTSDDQYFQLGTTQALANGGIDPASVTIVDETANKVTFVNGSTAPAGLAVNYRSVIGSLDRRTFNGIAGAEWQIGKIKLSARGTYARSRCSTTKWTSLRP
jgi:hypothetical protein